MKKELHAATCIIPLHLSAIGILPPIFLPVTIATFIRIAIYCDCSVLYYQWLFGQILHEGLYPLNILLWTINYLVVIKFSASYVTYCRVAAGLVTIWIISAIINFPIIFLTTASDYVDCCETVCRNGSALCNTPLRQTFTPHLFNRGGYESYITRNVLMIAVPTALGIATTVGSYYIYKKSSIKSTSRLKLRMILLPVLMTIVPTVNWIAHFSIEWMSVFHKRDERFPGNIVYIVFNMLWDVVYALMILFFNVTLRRECLIVKKEVLKCEPPGNKC